MCEASTPTRGGEAFEMNSPISRRFGSSGLNLAIEGLLLGGEPKASQKGLVTAAPVSWTRANKGRLCPGRETEA
jgi:hypothetical protein